MKKIFITVLFLFLISISSHAEVTSINVVIDGNQVIYNDDVGYPFLDESNRTQMPLRTCLETYGATVSWNNNTQSVIAVKNGIEVIIPINHKYIQKNGITIETDTSSRIINGRGYLPIRSVMEAFNCSVGWNEDTKTVTVIQEDVVAELLTATIETKSYPVNSTSSNLPSKYDSREVRGSTSVKSQRLTKTCWTFSTTAALESYLIGEQAYDFSEDNIIYNNEVYSDYTIGGSINSVFGYLTSWNGPVLESDDEFLDYKSNPEAKTVKHVQGIELIDSDINSMKQGIMDYGATQFTFYFNTNAMVYNKDTSSYYYNGVNENRFSHSVALVGWDDDFPKTNFETEPQNNGAFIAKNSYGPSFGDNGYFYISYDDYYVGNDKSPATIFSRIDDVDNYKHIYQYDLAGNNGSIGYDDSKAWFSNVFEKQSKNEVLKAVSFYTEGKESTYNIYYVDAFKTEADFDRMEILSSGNITNRGYHTIDFDSVKLSATGKFAIIVDIETPNSKFPIAGEFPSDRTQNVEAQLFQSFMSHDGIHWSDLAQKYDNVNVCLKAFTDEIDE